MTLFLVTPPAAEPVSVAEAKLFARIDHADEDTLIATLIAAARVAVEARLRRVLVTQAWRLVLDDWPRRGMVEIPLAPVASIDAVTVYDAGGLPIVLPPTDYVVDLVSTPARLVLRGVPPRPGLPLNGIDLDITAGYGAAGDVPAPIRTAILQLVALWYERREPVAFGGPVSDLPQTLDALIGPYRVLTL